MSDTSEKKLAVKCKCGAKFRVPATAVGKRAKCPKCQNVLAIKAPTPEPVASTPLEHQPDDDFLAGFGDAEEAADALPPLAAIQTAPASQPKQSSAWREAAGGVGNAAAGLAAGASRFLIGVVCCAGGAAVGGVLWFAIAWHLGIEIGWLAVGIGVIAGFGMRLGSQSESFKGGVIASLMAVAAIVGAKAAIYVAIFGTMDMSAADATRRNYVQSQYAWAILADKEVDYDAVTDEQFDVAFEEARPRVEEMSKQEIEDFIRSDPELEAEVNNTIQELDDEGVTSFGSMFGPLDLLWFVLALGSAFKIAGATADD